ncbi:MAG: hypothetical protein K2Q25_11975 [Mycobacteriaceae bacterium]|nr:hypothetical protein [Mycobacteriaceae bacterium]
MLIWRRPIPSMIEFLGINDPEREGLRYAIRAAVMVPAATILSFCLFGITPGVLFAYLGAYWLMVFCDFPGNRQSRALAYFGLGVIGCVFIAIGTLVSPIPWLAVLLMFVLGVVLTVAGAASATISAGQHAALMLCLCPVLMPVGSISERLSGWLVALLICVPASLFFLPPRHHRELRRHVALVCAALAERLEGSHSSTEVMRALDALHTDFLAASSRPAGLGAGSRALVRVVDHLQLVGDLADDHTATVLGCLRQPTIDVLRCCELLLTDFCVAHRATNQAALEQALINSDGIGTWPWLRRRSADTRRFRRCCRDNSCPGSADTSVGCYRCRADRQSYCRGCRSRFSAGLGEGSRPATTTYGFRRPVVAGDDRSGRYLRRFVSQGFGGSA